MCVGILNVENERERERERERTINCANCVTAEDWRDFHMRKSILLFRWWASYFICVWKNWAPNKAIAFLRTSLRYGSNVLTKIFFNVQSYRDVEMLVCVFCGNGQDSRVNSMSFCYLWFITTKYGINFWDSLGRSESCLLTYSDYSLFLFLWS